MALPPFMYEPLVTPRLFGALDPTQSLMGGGPAYTTIMPGFMPEPAEGPAPVAMTPQEEFLARVQQIEAMVPGVLPAAPPSIMPSPSAPPIMSAPDFGALNIGGGPAYVDIMPGQALPYDGEPMAQPSMVPGAQPPSILPSPSAPPMMSAPSSDAPGFTPALLNQAAPAPEEGYLNPFDAEAYESNAAPLSQSGRVQEVNMPVAGAKPEYTAGGALVFNTGRGAMGGFAVPIPGATYALIDNKTGKVITSGTGQAGLEQVWQAANDRSADMGKKANWSVVGVDPTNGREFSVAKDTPPASALGIAADFALPVAGALLAPVTFGGSAALGAALGSAGSSALQGRSLGDTLLRAGITAGTTALIGGAPGMGSVTSSKAGTVAGSALGAKASPLLGEIIVQGATSAVPSFVGSAAGGALSNLAGMAPGKGADFADRVFEQPSTPAVQPSTPLNTVSGDPITVLANRVPTGGALPIAGAGSVIGAGSLLGSAIGSAPAPTAPEGEIVVQTNRTPPPPPASNYVLNTLLPAIGAANVTPTSPTTPADGEIVVQENRTPPPLESFAPGLAAGAAVLPDLTKTPVDVPNPAEKNSLLDEIIKYYRLASVAADALGGAFGGGGGTAVPYTSRLGAMPTFTRGAFTPFAGDYETYGFGPEFNFFGGAPTPTPTAPDMGILPPAAQPGPRLFGPAGIPSGFA